MSPSGRAANLTPDFAVNEAGPGSDARGTAGAEVRLALQLIGER
jgi:hypothetical protein